MIGWSKNYAKLINLVYKCFPFDWRKPHTLCYRDMFSFHSKQFLFQISFRLDKLIKLKKPHVTWIVWGTLPHFFQIFTCQFNDYLIVDILSNPTRTSWFIVLPKYPMYRDLYLTKLCLEIYFCFPPFFLHFC